MQEIANVLGGKWKLVIIEVLIFSGTQRFNNLLKAINGINQSALTKQLRDLESDGLVYRVVVPDSPIRVEYSASIKAEKLKPTILM